MLNLTSQIVALSRSSLASARHGLLVIWWCYDVIRASFGLFDEGLSKRVYCA